MEESPKKSLNSGECLSITPVTTSSEGVLAWRKMMNESTLTNQEKIEATKVLIRLRQIQEKNKALFDSLGLGHDGYPKDAPRTPLKKKLK